MVLPSGKPAVVELTKLRDYCLDPNHPCGRHKARVFALRLGLLRADALVVRVALLGAVALGSAVPSTSDGFGRRYTLDFLLFGPKGAGLVRSVWMVRADEDFPRFLSAYLLEVR